MIIHLCVNYGDSRFYDHILWRLNRHSKNVMFAPFRNQAQKGNIERWHSGDYKLFSDRIFNNSHRLLQSKKTFAYTKYVENEYEYLLDCNLVHAHSLFSDGSVALRLYRKYQKKYVITVRNTDINLFWRYFLWRRALGREIIHCAEKVFVPSESYRKKVENIFGQMNKKIVVIPNGISDEFYEEKNVYKNFEKKLLFIGELNSNKNILKLIKIVKTNPAWKLTVAGFGRLERLVKKRCTESKNCNFVGHIQGTDQIITIIDQSDIIVIPAKTELFGIALAESISRGKPIICMKNQGLDGFFKDLRIGLFLEKLDSRSLFKALEKISNNYDYYQANCLRARNTFQWAGIIKNYRHEYGKLGLDA